MLFRSVNHSIRPARCSQRRSHGFAEPFAQEEDVSLGTIEHADLGILSESACLLIKCGKLAIDGGECSAEMLWWPHRDTGRRAQGMSFGCRYFAFTQFDPIPC